jgi:hypothetical protein
MRYFEDVFLGVKTADMKLARKVCEELIGAPLKCTNSTFYGGDHCHTVFQDTSFDLRLNHHDDGDGWSWCIEDPRYPLVFTCLFRSPEMKQRILGRLDQFPLIELPEEDR